MNSFQKTPTVPIPLHVTLPVEAGQPPGGEDGVEVEVVKDVVPYVINITEDQYVKQSL